MSRFKYVAVELKRHAPFTAFGAFTGIILIGIITLIQLSAETSDAFFHTLHPTHIMLSALVTTAMYRRYGGSIVSAVVVGYIGSVAICSISDIFFPYLGGALIGFPITLHVCLIEHPWLITLSALVGISIGLLRPGTMLLHAGHVLVSTYASLFYLTAFGTADWAPLLPFIFPLLFIAVWIPCCVSDIVFPLMFVRKKRQLKRS